MTTVENKRLEFESKVNSAADFIEKFFEEYISDSISNSDREPLILRDTELSPIIQSTTPKYPYRKIEEALDAIAILNGAAFELENKLRNRGYVPSIRRGVICDFTYNIISGYWYRENVNWFSLDPKFIIDVDSEN